MRHLGQYRYTRKIATLQEQVNILLAPYLTLMSFKSNSLRKAWYSYGNATNRKRVCIDIYNGQIAGSGASLENNVLLLPSIPHCCRHGKPIITDMFLFKSLKNV
jgi:hypothetical protein